MLQWIKNLLCGKEIEGLRGELAECSHYLNESRTHLYEAKNELERYRKEAILSGEEAKKAKMTAAYFQDQIDKILRDETPWSKAKSGLLNRVRERRPYMTVCVHGPSIDVFRHQELRATEIRASVTLYMNEETMPELIADHLGNEVKFAVLAKWQEQSILNTKRSGK